MIDCVKELSVKKYGHRFTLFLMTSGRIDYRVDNGDLFTAKSLENGFLSFFNKQEIVVKGEIRVLDGLELDGVDYDELKSIQTSIFKKQEERSILSFADVKKEALHLVDKWERKVRSYKDKDKVKRKLCIHSFRIGNDAYVFVERCLPDVGVVINPDYLIQEGLPTVGGVPKQYGELMFWDFLFEDRGWERVRVLSNNELICLSIVEQYGYFAIPHKVDCRRDLVGGSAKKVKRVKSKKKFGFKKENSVSTETAQ